MDITMQPTYVSFDYAQDTSTSSAHCSAELVEVLLGQGSNLQPSGYI